MKKYICIFVIFLTGFYFVSAQENEQLLNRLNNKISNNPENPYFLKARGDVKILLGSY